MNEAAKFIMTEIPELVIAYGVSDEYSFVFHESCKLFERRERRECSDSFIGTVRVANVQQQVGDDYRFNLLVLLHLLVAQILPRSTVVASSSQF